MSSNVTERVATVANDLRNRGYSLREAERSIVSKNAGALTAVKAPIAVTQLVDANPLTVVSAIANAAHRGFIPVLVAAEHTYAKCAPLLADPFLLRRTHADGREFFAVEDRIRLADDRYACVAARGPFQWRETAGRDTDTPPLVLTVGKETVAVFDGVDELTCPGPSDSAFRYSYDRGENRLFRVFEAGKAIGEFPSVSAMRANRFRPVPLPLVPEHHIRTNAELARATLIATVSEEATIDADSTVNKDTTVDAADRFNTDPKAVTYHPVSR